MTAWMSKKKSICYLIEKRLWEEQLQVTLIRWGGGRGGPVGEQQAHLRDAGGQMSWRPVLLAFLGDPAETARSEGGLGCQSIPGRKRRLQPHQRFQKKSALGPGVPVLHAARPCREVAAVLLWLSAAVPGQGGRGHGDKTSPVHF